MADTAALLPPACNSDPFNDGSDRPHPPPTSVDATIESYIGENSLRQLLRAVFVAFAWVFDGQQTFINVFTDAEPSWHCTVAGNATSCTSASIPCGIPPGSWAWDLPADASVVSEWSLQCSCSAVVGLPASAFFAGCLVGGFLLATLADTVLGRKSMLVLSCLAMSLSSALTAASPDIWVYSALRFICGFARATVGTSALVLSTEVVGRRWRGRISIVGFFFFTLGFLSLPAIACTNRGKSWRILYLWVSIPSLLYSVLLHFVATESPRWLLVRGRGHEAAQILRRISSSGGSAIDSRISKVLLVAEEAGDKNIFSAMAIIWEKGWALRRLTATMAVGLGLGMIYYGMPLNVGNLGTNLYWSVAFNALAELPSSLATWFVIGRLNRRLSMLVFTTASGVLSVLCVAAADDLWRLAAEVASFFSACSAFQTLLVYGIELFPTCVRNSAISMLRQAVVFGGVFAPVLVAEGRKRGLFLTFGVFGVVIGVLGLLTVCLPETRGRSISDTMEEEESKLQIAAAAYNSNP